MRAFDEDNYKEAMDASFKVCAARGISKYTTIAWIPCLRAWACELPSVTLSWEWLQSYCGLVHSMFWDLGFIEYGGVLIIVLFAIICWFLPWALALFACLCIKIFFSHGFSSWFMKSMQWFTVLEMPYSIKTFLLFKFRVQWASSCLCMSVLLVNWLCQSVFCGIWSLICSSWSMWLMEFPHTASFCES